MPGMTQLIERAALVNPKGIASHFQGRDTTWAQLRELVPPLAGAFVAAGLRAGDRIAILSANSDFYFQYFFAAPWAGGVITPINARLSAPEALYWLQDSGSRILLVDAPLSPLRTGRQPHIDDRPTHTLP